MEYREGQLWMQREVRRVQLQGEYAQNIPQERSLPTPPPPWLSEANGRPGAPPRTTPGVAYPRTDPDGVHTAAAPVSDPAGSPSLYLPLAISPGVGGGSGSLVHRACCTPLGRFAGGTAGAKAARRTTGTGSLQPFYVLSDGRLGPEACPSDLVQIR